MLVGKSNACLSLSSNFPGRQCQSYVQMMLSLSRSLAMRAKGEFTSVVTYTNGTACSILLAITKDTKAVIFEASQGDEFCNRDRQDRQQEQNEGGQQQHRERRRWSQHGDGKELGQYQRRRIDAEGNECGFIRLRLRKRMEAETE